MSEKLYNLEFAGQIIPGWDIDEVKANLARLLKANEEKILDLFSGQRFLIKKNAGLKKVLIFFLHLPSADWPGWL